MTKRNKQPAPIVTLTARGLSPVSAMDAEEISAMAIGTEFDLVKRGKRSLKHLGTYWKALGGVVKATGRWPTAEHLHSVVMIECGYYSLCADLSTGDLVKVRDSVSFDSMSQDEFNAYFKTAMEKLASAVGYDPLRFMESPI